MKNQNDLIFQIVAGVLAVGCAVTFYFTKPVKSPPAPPTQVNISAPKLPDGIVTYANALPGGSSQAGGAPAGMRGGPGMMPGFGGGGSMTGLGGGAAAGGGGPRKAGLDGGG